MSLLHVRCVEHAADIFFENGIFSGLGCYCFRRKNKFPTGGALVAELLTTAPR
jgi:hypothetical protein